MSEKKIVVPEGIMDAALAALRSRDVGGTLNTGLSGDTRWPGMHAILEAALRWLSENPIVPTLMQIEAIRRSTNESRFGLLTDEERAFFFMVEWQRRCFLAPEQEESPKTFTIDQIEDAFRDTYSGGDYHPSAVWNKMRVNLGIAPEPQVLEEIKDLLLPEDVENGFFRPDTVNERMRECFRRGQKAGK